MREYNGRTTMLTAGGRDALRPLDLYVGPGISIHNFAFREFHDSPFDNIASGDDDGSSCSGSSIGSRVPWKRTARSEVAWIPTAVDLTPNAQPQSILRTLDTSYLSGFDWVRPGASNKAWLFRLAHKGLFFMLRVCNVCDVCVWS